MTNYEICLSLDGLYIFFYVPESPRDRVEPKTRYFFIRSKLKKKNQCENVILTMTQRVE